jgi:hypothetical protein
MCSALVVAVAGGGISIALGRSTRDTTRNDIVWAGLSCPAGDQVASTHLDGVETRGTSTPQGAIAPFVKRVAPGLYFDENAQRDLAPQDPIAEFAVTDGEGYTVARFEANEIDGSWYPTAWRTCSSVGAANSPDRPSSP